MGREKIINFDEVKRGIEAKRQKEDLYDIDKFDQLLFETYEDMKKEAAGVGRGFPDLDKMIKVTKEEAEVSKDSTKGQE